MRLFQRKNEHGFGNDFSIGKIFAAPFRWLFGLLGGADSEFGHQVSTPKRIWRQLLRVVIFPFWFIGQLLKFLILSWTTTRNGSAALLGLLPLIVILGMIGVSFVSGFVEDRLTKSLHRVKVVESEKAEDFETAVLCSRRVQNIDSGESWAFIHGLTLIGAGLEENGLAIIQEIADPNTAGYLPAHIFLAKRLAGTRDDDPAYQDNLAIAYSHLERVEKKASHKRDPSYMQAARLLPMVMHSQAIISNDAELLDAAMKKFADISDDYPDVIPRLAQYLVDNGRYDDASFHITRGMDRLKAEAQVNPNNPGIWRVMYEILMVKQDYLAAIEELDKGLAMATDNAVRVQILSLQSNVFVKIAKTVESIETQDGFRSKLMAVCQGLQRYPRNAAAINEFIDLVLNPTNENIDNWLQEEARDNLSPAIFHIINGARDSINGKPATGGKHFRLAFNGDSRAAFIVNDIAFYLCMEKDRSGDALRLVDVAIDTWNTSGKLFQTRGEILMKLERHQEAVAELEYAAQQINNDPYSFAVLADCYDALGRTDEASANRAKSVALQEELDKRIKALRERLVSGQSG